MAKRGEERGEEDGIKKERTGGWRKEEQKKSNVCMNAEKAWAIPTASLCRVRSFDFFFSTLVAKTFVRGKKKKMLPPATRANRIEWVM